MKATLEAEAHVNALFLELVHNFDGDQHAAIREMRARAQIESWQERLPIATERPGWRNHTACDGLNEFMDLPTSDAVAICQHCPVRLSCLAASRYEITHLDAGVYTVRGGLTPDQREAVYATMPIEPFHPECGTDSGYHRHIRRSEPACTDCLGAHARTNQDNRRRRGRPTRRKVA